MRKRISAAGVFALVFPVLLAMSGASSQPVASPRSIRPSLLPMLLRQPPPPPTAPTPSASPSAGATPTVQLDLSNLGASLNPAIFGVDQAGDSSQGVWDQTPPGSATPMLFSSAAALTGSMHLGFVRMERLVNALPNCTPHLGITDCGRYRWQDHVGPTSSRPGNEASMGPDDYVTMLRQTAAGSQPFIVANMETATVQDIADEVAYVNGISGPMADWRKANTGGAGPYDVVYWELGNEEYNAYRLRPSLADRARNPGNCPDYTASVENDFTVAELYGCLLRGYSSAMRSAEAASGGRVAIRIVANFNGSSDWMRGLMATASGAFDDVDYHDYTSPTDSSNTVFDRDGQWTTYSVHPVTGVLPQQVSYAFWVTGSDSQGPPVLEARLDGTPLMLHYACGMVDCVGSRITADNFSTEPQLLLATAVTRPGARTLSVTACSSAAFSKGSCPAAGTGAINSRLVVNLRHVSTAMGAQSTASMLSGRQGMSPASCGTWRPDPDTLIDTRIGTTQPGSAMQPWRLSGNDFATATTARIVPDVAKTLTSLSGIVGQQPGTGIFVGEYSYFGGCDTVPLNLTETHESGIAAVQRIIGYLSGASSSSAPLLGAAMYQLNSFEPNGPYCAGWALVREVSGTVNGRPACLAPNRPDQSYLTAAGQDIALAGMLNNATGGRSVPLSISGPTLNLPRVVDAPPAAGVPAVSGVAFHYDDGTTRVLLVNTLPSTSLSETIGGAQFSSAEATGVFAPPESMNSDGDQQAVTSHPVSTSISAGEVMITLPPFSCTLIVLH